MREELRQHIYQGSSSFNPLTLTWQSLWGLDRLHTVWLPYGDSAFDVVVIIGSSAQFCDLRRQAFVHVDAPRPLAGGMRLLSASIKNP